MSDPTQGHGLNITCSKVVWGVCVEVQSWAGVHVSAKSSAEPECVGDVSLQEQRFVEAK